MAQLTLSVEEQQRLNAVCEEFDPAEHDLTRSYLEGIEDLDEKLFVIEHLRNSLRRRLWSGFLLEVVAERLNEDFGDDTGDQFLLDELDRSDPGTGMLGRDKGALRTRFRRLLGDGFGYIPLGEVRCNVILQQVNQDSGRAVGEAQTLFVTLADMAARALFPRWSDLQVERLVDEAEAVAGWEED